jgi:hypothetical protein
MPVIDMIDNQIANRVFHVGEVNENPGSGITPPRKVTSRT